MMNDRKGARAPLSDAITAAVAHLLDDSRTEVRQPSHSEIEQQFVRAGLRDADPNKEGKPVGKAKRVRGVLTWAIEYNREAGERLVYYLNRPDPRCGRLP